MHYHIFNIPGEATDGLQSDSYWSVACETCKSWAPLCARIFLATINLPRRLTGLRPSASDMQRTVVAPFGELQFFSWLSSRAYPDIAEVWCLLGLHVLL